MNAAQKFLLKRKKNISDALALSATEYHPETYHSLRVEIKKIRAFLHLRKAVDKKTPIGKWFRPFKKIFRVAGLVREQHIALEILNGLNGYSPDNLYLRHLSGNLDRFEQCYFKLPLHKLHRRINKSMDGMIKSMEQPNTDKWVKVIKNKEKSLKEILSKSKPKSSELHDIRKTLKEYQYNGMWIPGTFNIAVRIIPPEIQQYIGQWHDYQCVYKDLKHLYKKKKPTGDAVNELRILLSILDTERSMYRQKIRSVFNNTAQIQLHGTATELNTAPLL